MASAISSRLHNVQEKISLVPYLDLLNEKALEALKNKKNLLAFSAGVDSSALFFLLLKVDIPFDIAIVDYGMRRESKEEVAYAKELARSYDKRLYHDSIRLSNSNFEHQARVYRYNFFEEIIKEYNYDNLITAHQLNDRLEWFLMQLSKGAGLVEMLGFDVIQERQEYKLIRPLIECDKASLLAYLERESIKYFIDGSNSDTKYKRNQIRTNYSDDFLATYKKGILKSFDYLQKDKIQLFSHKLIYHDRALYIIKKSPSQLRSIDKICKEMGYLLSGGQKEEIAKEKELVIGGKIVISFTKEYIFITPYSEITMDKKFKERCRVLGIPTKVRPYLYQMDINPNDLPLLVRVS